jgi:hypothetical protein
MFILILINFFKIHAYSLRLFRFVSSSFRRFTVIYSQDNLLFSIDLIFIQILLYIFSLWSDFQTFIELFVYYEIFLLVHNLQTAKELN